MTFDGTGTSSPQGHCHFYYNKGSAVVSSNSRLKFHKVKIELKHNVIDTNHRHEISSTVIFANSSSVVFDSCFINFESNYGQQCGGIMATNKTTVSFKYNSKANFTGNYGEQGGAISLDSMSVLIVSNIKLTFLSNKAQKGGAIFIDDSTYTYAQKLQTSAIQEVGASASLTFSNNTAVMGGNNIYGGWIGWSISKKGITHSVSLLNSLEFADDVPGITSDPIRICMCTNQVPNCSVTNLKLTQIYPGQTINIDAVAVGQRNGTVVAPATAELIQSNNHTQTGRIRDLQAIQVVDKTCTNLSYTIMSPNKEERVLISVFRSNEFGISDQNKDLVFGSQLLKTYPYKLGLLFTQFTIEVKLKDCPLTFSLDKTQHTCVCPPSLKSIGISCDLNVYKILSSEQQWIGITYNHTTKSEYPGIVAHQHCPYDYCKNKKSLSVAN